MEDHDTMGWSGRGVSQAQMAAEGSALDDGTAAVPVRPKSISELEEERRLQEFQADPGGFIEKAIRGLCSTVFQLKVLALLILTLLPFAQYTISPLAENILFGHSADMTGAVIAIHSSDVATTASYNLPSPFYVVVGIFMGIFFFLAAIIPWKASKNAIMAICGLILFFYVVRAIDMVQGEIGGGGGGVESILVAILVFLFVILATCYLIVVELGIMLFIAGPTLAGTYGILKASPRAIKFSFFLFILYIFDAVGTLSEHFVSFIFFGILLFAFIFLGFSICDIHNLHKENKERVTYRGKRMVLVPGQDRNLETIKESLDHHSTLLLANLSLITVMAMVIFFSSKLVGFFLGAALFNSLEMETVAGKLITISTILFFLMFLKLFFGAPTDQIDRKVFKRQRLERILSEKKNSFYVETVSEEQHVHQQVRD